MHMTLRKLKARKHDTVTLLEIVSMEGRYYMARFYIDGSGYILTDENDHVLMFSGACAAREVFQDLHVEHVDVLPPTGTDEMIGMPDTSSEPMRVPF